MDGKVVLRLATYFDEVDEKAVGTRSRLPMSVNAFWNVTMMA